MNKISCKFIGVVAVLGLLAAGKIILGADNQNLPYRYDSPQSSEPFAMTSANSTITINLLEPQKPDGPAIKLQIPTKYIDYGESDDRKKVIGPLAFYLTYPDLKGGREKDNADIPFCSGPCRGLTQVTLYSSSNRFENRDSVLEDFINDRLKYTLKRAGRFSHTHEEYDVMWTKFPFKVWRSTDANTADVAPGQKTAPTLPSPNPPPGYTTEALYNAYVAHPWPAAHIFVFRQNDGRKQIIECKESGVRGVYSMCEYTGISSKNQNLKFSVSFSYENMEGWPTFVRRLSDLIDSFIL